MTAADDGAIAGLATPLGMLERMWLIRAFEERASRLFAEGHIPGLLHLGIGQEGVAVGLASVSRLDDLEMGEVFQGGLHEFIQVLLATTRRLNGEIYHAYHF